MKRTFLAGIVFAALLCACEQRPSDLRPSDTLMSGESFPLTQVVWSLMFSADLRPEPVTRQRLGLSDSDVRTFLTFAAEAKRRIQAHQRESAAALCAERDAIQTRFDLSRAFLELASANALMESTLVWELLGRLGDAAARDLVTHVHEARMRGDTPVALSGDLPLFFLLQGQDVRAAVDGFCETAARVAAN